MMPGIAALDFPFSLLNGVKTSSFDPVTINMSSRGMFSGKGIPAGPFYQIWQATLPFEDMKPEKWRELSGLVAYLYASRTPVRIFDPVRQKPLGRVSNVTPGSTSEPWSDDTYFSDGTGWDSNYYDGLRVAEVASKDGDSIRFSGAVASQANAVVSGDLFEVNGFLYMSAATVRSDSSGNGRIQVRPRLREGIAVGDILKFNRPRTAFYITDADGLAASRTSITRRANATITFTEAVG